LPWCISPDGYSEIQETARTVRDLSGCSDVIPAKAEALYNSEAGQSIDIHAGYMPIQ